MCRYYESLSINSEPRIMLWDGIHCPNHFLLPEIEKVEGFVTYNECGGPDTFKIVPVATPANQREGPSDSIEYSMTLPGRTLRPLNEDEIMSHESDYLSFVVTMNQNNFPHTRSRYSRQLAHKQITLFQFSSHFLICAQSFSIVLLDCAHFLGKTA